VLYDRFEISCACVRLAVSLTILLCKMQYTFAATFSLTGTIPTSIGSMESLELLSLSTYENDDRLTVYLSVNTTARLFYLRRCPAGENEIDGSLPTEAGRLPRLAFVNLRKSMVWMIHSFIVSFIPKMSYASARIASSHACYLIRFK